MTKLIEIDKKYKTREGKDVRILCVDAPESFPVVCIVDNEYIITCNKYGNWEGDGEELPYDLIEVPPFAEFKKDDKVMVRNINNESWEKRYFSHKENGVAYCFVNGSTSWSYTQTIGWNQCRKPTHEELE